MSWFSLLKKKNRTRHVRDMYKKVRTVARPILDDLMEKYASDKNKIYTKDIEELIQREIIDSGILYNHPDLADIPGENFAAGRASRFKGPRHRYVNSSKPQYMKIATYKLRQIGFERKEETLSGIKVSYYNRGD